MKLLRVIPALLLPWLGEVSAVHAAPSEATTFLSALRYSGTQWQVKSAIGPVYLARLEGGVWRTLACFDGTNGKYFLTWENPRQGVYAAVDPNGACSEFLAIGPVSVGGHGRGAASPAARQPASGRWVFEPSASIAARTSSR